MVDEPDTLPSPRLREAGDSCIDGFDVKATEVIVRLCWELLGLLWDGAALAGGKICDEFHELCKLLLCMEVALVLTLLWINRR